MTLTLSPPPRLPIFPPPRFPVTLPPYPWRCSPPKACLVELASAMRRDVKPVALVYEPSAHIKSRDQWKR